MEQALNLIHPPEGGIIQFFVLPVNQDEVDHGGQQGVGFLVLMAPGVGQLELHPALVGHHGLEVDHLVGDSGHVLGLIGVLGALEVAFLLD